MGSPPFTSLCTAYKRQGGWEGLISWLHTQNELELVRGKAEQVQIMTLHAAKGLEFQAVFLPCLEDGLLPFSGIACNSPGHTHRAGMDPDEERRLFYVGVTRAKTSLFLSRAAERRVYGQTMRLNPSPFLADIPQEVMIRLALVAQKKTSGKAPVSFTLTADSEKKDCVERTLSLQTPLQGR